MDSRNSSKVGEREPLAGRLKRAQIDVKQLKRGEHRIAIADAVFLLPFENRVLEREISLLGVHGVAPAGASAD